MTRKVRIVCHGCMETHKVETVGKGTPKLCDGCKADIAEARKMAAKTYNENKKGLRHTAGPREQRQQAQARKDCEDADLEPIRSGKSIIAAAMRKT